MGFECWAQDTRKPNRLKLRKGCSVGQGMGAGPLAPRVPSSGCTDSSSGSGPGVSLHSQPLRSPQREEARETGGSTVFAVARRRSG